MKPTLESDSFYCYHKYNISNISKPVRIAAFDLDDTLIHRKRGKNPTWNFVFDNWKEKIVNLINDNYLIIVFSNQSGFNKTKVIVLDAIKNIIRQLRKTNFFFGLYIAKKTDLYRKPNIGMWNLMKQDIMNIFELDSIKISRKAFFCGDAAGRYYPKKDFSDSDRKFAMNLNIKFCTPEEFFKGENNSVWKLSGINPEKIIHKKCDSHIFHPKKKEIILMIGFPASGKSEYVRNNILCYDYDNINQDELKTKTKCISETEKSLIAKHNVVVDNTNSKKADRAIFIKLAEKYNYSIRAFIMTSSMEISKHMNNVRHLYSDGTIPKIPDVAYNVFNKYYVEPTMSEGFDKIVKINLCISEDKLGNKKWLKCFNTLI
jgi:bifunctional polynucleotide phosphatase/kinase